MLKSSLRIAAFLSFTSFSCANVNIQPVPSNPPVAQESFGFRSFSATPRTFSAYSTLESITSAIDPTLSDINLYSGNHAVGNDGSLGYTYDFDLPDAPGLNAPIALEYNSNNKNGRAGYGWNVSGLQTIVICRAEDTGSSPVQSATTDSYCINGERLVKIDEAGSYFRLENDKSGEFYEKKLNGNDWVWERRSASGDITKYDNIGYDNVHSSKPRSWSVSYKSSPDGSYVSYSYVVFGSNSNDRYIDTLEYGDDNSSVTVDFDWVDSKNEYFYYEDGLKYEFEMLLDSVTVSTDNSSVVHDLIYEDYSRFFVRETGYRINPFQVLDSIRRNVNGIVDVIEYDYTHDGGSVFDVSYWDPYVDLNSKHLNSSRVAYLSADLDRDGRDEFFAYHNGVVRVYNWYGSVLAHTNTIQLPTSIETNFRAVGTFTATDRDGDGQEEILLGVGNFTWGSKYKNGTSSTNKDKYDTYMQSALFELTGPSYEISELRYERKYWSNDRVPYEREFERYKWAYTNLKPIDKSNSHTFEPYLYPASICRAAIMDCDFVEGRDLYHDSNLDGINELFVARQMIDGSDTYELLVDYNQDGITDYFSHSESKSPVVDSEVIRVQNGTDFTTESSAVVTSFSRDVVVRTNGERGVPVFDINNDGFLDFVGDRGILLSKSETFGDEGFRYKPEGWEEFNGEYAVGDYDGDGFEELIAAGKFIDSTSTPKLARVSFNGTEVVKAEYKSATYSDVHTRAGTDNDGSTLEEIGGRLLVKTVTTPAGIVGYKYAGGRIHRGTGSGEADGFVGFEAVTTLTEFKTGTATATKIQSTHYDHRFIGQGSINVSQKPLAVVEDVYFGSQASARSAVTHTQKSVTVAGAPGGKLFTTQMNGTAIASNKDWFDLYDFSRTVIKRPTLFSARSLESASSDNLTEKGFSFTYWDYYVLGSNNEITVPVKSGSSEYRYKSFNNSNNPYLFVNESVEHTLVGLGKEFTNNQLALHPVPSSIEVKKYDPVKSGLIASPLDFPVFEAGKAEPENGTVYSFNGELWEAKNSPGIWETPREGWYWTKYNFDDFIDDSIDTNGVLASPLTRNYSVFEYFGGPSCELEIAQCFTIISEVTNSSSISGDQYETRKDTTKLLLEAGVALPEEITTTVKSSAIGALANLASASANVSASTSYQFKTTNTYQTNSLENGYLRIKNSITTPISSDQGTVDAPRTVSYTYDKWGNVATETDSYGATTSYSGTNNAAQKPTTVSYSDGLVETLSYSIYGNLGTKTNNRGLKERYERFYCTDLSSVSEISTCSGNGYYIERVESNQAGIKLSEFDILGNKVSDVYYTHGSAGEVVKYRYSTTGVLVEQSQPYVVDNISNLSLGTISITHKPSMKWEANAFGLISKAISFTGGETSFSYSMYSSGSSTDSTIDKMASWSKTSTVWDGDEVKLEERITYYDALNRVVGETQVPVNLSGTENYTVSHTLDYFGNALFTKNGSTTLYQGLFNGFGKEYVSVDNYGIRQETLFNAFGEPVEEYVQGERTSVTSYDQVGRVQETATSETSQVFTYDGATARLTLETHSGPSGLITKEPNYNATSGRLEHVLYKYNVVGQNEQQVKFKYNYNDNGQYQWLVPNVNGSDIGHLFHRYHEKSGNLSFHQLGLGNRINYTVLGKYSSYGLREQTLYNYQSPSSHWQNYTVKTLYSELGLPKEYNVTGDHSHQMYYDYDSRGYLTGERYYTVNRTFQYNDPLGTRLSSASDGGTQAYRYDRFGQLDSVPEGNVERDSNGQLRGIGGGQYGPPEFVVHDSRGRITQSNNRIFAYDDLNRLTQVLNGDSGRRANYLYTGGQLAVSIDSPNAGGGEKTTTFFLPHGFKYSIVETLTSQSRTSKVTHSLSASGINLHFDPTESSSATTQAIVRNHLGNMVAVLASNDTNLIDPYKISPYGLTQNGGNAKTNQLVQDKPQYDNFQIVHFGGRVYDLYSRQFLTPDPIVPNHSNISHWGRYSYGYGNPYGHVDPTGYYQYPMNGTDTNSSNGDTPSGANTSDVKNIGGMPYQAGQPSELGKELGYTTLQTIAEFSVVYELGQAVYFASNGDWSGVKWAVIGAVPIAGDGAKLAKRANDMGDLVSPSLVKSVSSVPGRVQSRINISNDGWKHTIQGHFNPSRSNKSQFSITQDELKILLADRSIVQSPAKQLDTGNFGRTITIDRKVGNLAEKWGGASTNTFSIVTDFQGNLLTATPGKL